MGGLIGGGEGRGGRDKESGDEKGGERNWRDGVNRKERRGRTRKTDAEVLSTTNRPKNHQQADSPIIMPKTPTQTSINAYATTRANHPIPLYYLPTKAASQDGMHLRPSLKLSYYINLTKVRY